MGFYYAAEKKRFDRKWDKLRREYEAAGMTVEAIQQIYEFDWTCFCSQRTYANHTQTLPDESVSDDETERSTLFRKYINNMVSFDNMSTASRYAWVDTIRGKSQRHWGCTRTTYSSKELQRIFFLISKDGQIRCKAGSIWPQNSLWRAVSQRSSSVI